MASDPKRVYADSVVVLVFVLICVVFVVLSVFLVCVAAVGACFLRVIRCLRAVVHVCTQAETKSRNRSACDMKLRRLKVDGDCVIHASACTCAQISTYQSTKVHIHTYIHIHTYM
jgi:hypothetical protein